MSTAPHIRCDHACTNAPAIPFTRATFALLLCSVFLASAPQLLAQSTDSQESSQDVAEAARQERARKQQAAGQHHVYTNEDLRKGKILTQEDATRSATTKQNQSPALNTKPNTESLDANSAKPREPLGDVARRYRNARREAIHPSPFHLPANQLELAAPKILTPIPALGPNTQPQPPAKNFASVNPSAPLYRAPIVNPPAPPSVPSRRVDPFSRHHLQPVPPTIAVHPVEPRTSAQPKLPVQPRSAIAAPANSIVVRSGDTLWSLSRRHLGRGTRWLELMAANPSLPDPTRLAPGTTLIFPARATSGHLKVQKQTISVQPGDTLSAIALAAYGHASAWPCVAQANPSLQSPDRLSVGQTLSLPASCTL